MTRDHLAAFLWLRWRLRVNQFRKAGAVNAALFTVFVAGCLAAAVALFVVGVVVGLVAFRGAPAHVHLFVWDGVVAALLFCWLVGLMTDLQRSEALSLDRFLHLPVSLSGAFLVNYLSSLASLTLVAFVPGMVGLVLGLAVSRGPVMLLLLPPLVAAVFALTAVTYQFQGWLASLMANPRRRRTVVVLVTAGFILVAQAPQLVNVVRPWEASNAPADRRVERLNAMSEDLRAGRLTPEESGRRTVEINELYEAERREEEQRDLDRALRVARVLNLVLPPGWLPLAAEGLADGAVGPALLGTLGLALIGSASLWRAYRTTVRLYTGRYTAGDTAGDVAAEPATPAADPGRVRLVERRLPGVGEPASAVAAAGLRALARAPEAKMAFLAPLVLVVVFGGLAASIKGEVPSAVRPLLAFTAGWMVMGIAGLQLMGNQFGYDRAGFRAYVLSPLPRTAILVGKNLAAAPLVLGLGVLGAAVAGVVYPMRADHYPAVLAEVLSTYLALCLLSNAVSIAAPVPMAAGSMQPSSIRAWPVLAQMLALMCLPVLVVPILVPYGLEVLLDQLGVLSGWPVALPLTLGVLAAAVLVYRQAVRWQGRWLAAREQAILEVVASRAE